jgi:hypothetical protein
MDLKTQLQKLFEKYESDIGSYAWMYETDRWAELIFCLLNQYNQQDAESTRMAVTSLQYLGLLEIDKLAVLGRIGGHLTYFFAYI